MNADALLPGECPMINHRTLAVAAHVSIEDEGSMIAVPLGRRSARAPAIASRHCLMGGGPCDRWHHRIQLLEFLDGDVSA
jgi:hypothetical protein